MASKTEPAVLSDGVKWEQDSDYSREQITVASGADLTVLTVLGKVTADGKYVQLDPSASDGSESAAGILVADTAAASADAESAAIVRDALVIADALVWPSGITANQKTTALGELAALGIHTREAA